MRLFLMLPFAAAALTAACTPKAGAPAAAAAVDTAAAKTGIDSTRTRYAALQVAGDATGIAGLFDEQAGVDIYGMPRTQGRANIEAAMKNLYGMRKYSVTEIMPLETNVRTNQDGSEIGTYHDMYEEKGVKTHEWGRFLVGLVKSTDGVWRLSYLMAFPDSLKVEK
ncbi:MAG TPA: hypothetical protein VIP80_07330 [Gemmatimonadales bacterium]|jgi:ketosteroid isomerase-like protein